MCVYIHIYIYLHIYIYRVILQNDAHLRHGKTELLISFRQNRGKKKSGRCQNPYYYNDDCPSLMDCIIYDNRL